MAKTLTVVAGLTAISETMTQLEYRGEFLSRSLSECDGLRNDILHYLELEKMSAVEHTKLTYKLKEVMKRRRTVKDELKMLNDFKGTLSMHPKKYGKWLNEAVDRESERNYTPRQKTLKQLLGE